jgi:hypothetical protein
LPGSYILRIMEEGSLLVLPRFLTMQRSLLMAKIRCDNITDGLRRSEAVASFTDYHGRTHFIRVERDFLTGQAGSIFLPVGVVHVDPKKNLVLIELPHEAETGVNRVWVKQEQLDEPIEAYA